ncbi:MAG: domain S-box protein [Chitinophagaceae bacterium]|nr:domain S-box protein [Chitinophagaceae bacterium]
MLKSSFKYYFSFVKIVNRYLWSGEAVKTRPAYVRYGFSIILLAFITLLKLQYFDYIGEKTPFLLYFGVVIIATGFGGVGPGIFSTIISAVVCDYFFIPPVNEFHFNKTDNVQVLVFVLECLLLISLSGAVTRASARVRKTAERFHALVENSADGIAVADASGKVLYASPSVKKALGYTVREFRKLDPWTKIHPEEMETIKKFYADVMRSPGISKSILHLYLHKNGSWVWVENTITNLLDHPSVKGIVSNFKNITERVVLEKQKEDFVGIATHELKTPVTSIKAYAQILLRRFDKDGNIAAANMVEKMDVQLNKLIALIGDLLDVTKIEAGRLALHEEFYDFNKLINEIAEELQRTTSDHKIILTLEQAPEIYGDKERIGQVLTNLLSNAIKYSPASGEIKIFLTVNTNQVMVCVQDRGLGISKDHREKVFERFYRVSGPEGDSFPGLGLGLYISHEIIKRQGGRIWVESEKGNGSVFCFTLPLDYRMNSENHKTITEEK